MSVAIRRALYGVMAGDTTLNALLGTPPTGFAKSLYYQQAPQGAGFPYIIFQHQAGTPAYAMGERAYGTLAETERGPGLEDLYAELAGRFPQFVDLFAEIAELSDLRSNRGLVRLYERYLATRDARVGKLLRDRGVALFSGPGAPPKGRLPQ